MRQRPLSNPYGTTSVFRPGYHVETVDNLQGLKARMMLVVDATSRHSNSPWWLELCLFSSPFVTAGESVAHAQGLEPHSSPRLSRHRGAIALSAYRLGLASTCLWPRDQRTVPAANGLSPLFDRAKASFVLSTARLLSMRRSRGGIDNELAPHRSLVLSAV